MASAPALTMGFMVRSALSSMAMTESKGSPVLLTPSLRRASSGPSASQTRAKTKSLEMLWMVNSTSASPMAKTPPPTPATQTPKASGGAVRQRRDVVGHPPLSEIAEPVVPLGHERLYLVGRREVSGRDSLYPRTVAGRLCRLRSASSVLRLIVGSVGSVGYGAAGTSVTSSSVIAGNSAMPRSRCRSHTSRILPSSGESLSMRNSLKVPVSML